MHTKTGKDLVLTVVQRIFICLRHETYIINVSVFQLYGYGVQHHVSDITSETAEDFCFNLLRFFKREAFLDCGGVQLADGGWLITRNDGTAGKEEFYRYLFIAFIFRL